MDDFLKPKVGGLYKRNGVLVWIRGMLPCGDAFALVVGMVAKDGFSPLYVRIPFEDFQEGIFSLESEYATDDILRLLESTEEPVKRLGALEEFVHVPKRKAKQVARFAAVTFFGKCLATMYTHQNIIEETPFGFVSRAGLALADLALLPSAKNYLPPVYSAYIHTQIPEIANAVFSPEFAMSVGYYFQSLPPISFDYTQRRSQLGAQAA